jgi:cyanophycin synthetase
MAFGNTLASKMKVLGKAIYHGPHLHSRTPMIRIELDLGILNAWPTSKIPHFNDKLLSLLPGLRQHGCSYNAPGGFVRRLSEGTWLGHVAEHVALELQSLTGAEVTRGKTRSIEKRPGVYNVMFEYDTENQGLWAGRFALEIVNSLLPEELAGISGLEALAGGYQAEFSSVDESVQRLKAIARQERLGPTARSIVEAAKRRGIPSLRLDDQSLVQLGMGKHQRRIRGSITDATSQIAVETASDKALTKQLLAAAGVPVPAGDVVRDAEAAVAAAQKIGYPVVLKPLDGNHGRGVSTDITTAGQVREAFALAREHSETVVVEQYYTGNDYRVLVVGGQVVAVTERIPAHVTGDGAHSVAELIDILNADPRRGNGHEAAMTRVAVDRHVERMLDCAGLSLSSIPPAGKKVQLRGTANISTGGMAADRTDDIHPLNTTLMERAARAIGLDVAGIDVVTGDISLPIAQYGGGVIEVNASPGFRMHLHPAEGRARPVGEPVVSLLFPQGVRSSVPIAAITGTNGKSTTVRMVAHILRQNNHCVGFTSTSGIHIDNEMIWQGDASGPQSARKLLGDRSLDFAVLETARGGILREGLAFENCDVGAVLNVTPDHLGLGGVDTLEDLAAVKSVVTESVGKHGLSVLNGDDPLTRGIARDAGGRLCFFSMHGGSAMSEHLRAHINNNGMAVVLENWGGDNQIVIHLDGRRIPLIGINQIPAALGGIARCNIQNALAAAAIAFGMGADVKTIRAGLGSFSSSFEQSPGRLNIFDGHGFRVILDYAHNPAALSALLDVVRHMKDNYRNIIGTVSTPGDRRDNHIREMGRIAAEDFDFLVFREGPDTRGRAAGEVVRLLTEGARSARFPDENIVQVGPEEEAIDICLQKAAPGDLVVLMPTDVEGCWQRVLSFIPQQPMPPPLQDKHLPRLSP